MRRIGRYILNICAAVLLCGCYNSTQLPESESSNLKPNVTLAELRKLWRGKTFEVNEPMVVGGVVTSSDKAGNFYQTFTISDGTGSAEIRAGMRDLHNPYPEGCRLFVRLDGCAVGVERGVLQIGLMPESYSNYAVDYFYSRVMLDRHIVRSGEIVAIEPTEVGINELSVEMCGALVRLDMLQYAIEDENQPETIDFTEKMPLAVTWSGYRAFVDVEGNKVYTFTSDYADFAALEVPNGLCSITAILQYVAVQGASGDWFILKMRSENDCVPSVDSTL